MRTSGFARALDRWASSLARPNNRRRPHANLRTPAQRARKNWPARKRIATDYLPFVAFSIAVFDALHERGWPRIESGELAAGRCAIEVFPRAAWLRLGRRSLPAKSKCRPETVAEFHAGLVRDFSIHDEAQPTHDELQALVAGVAGLSLIAGDRDAYELVGEMPRRVAGVWREGFILAPRQ